MGVYSTQFLASPPLSSMASSFLRILRRLSEKQRLIIGKDDCEISSLFSRGTDMGESEDGPRVRIRANLNGIDGLGENTSEVY